MTEDLLIKHDILVIDVGNTNTQFAVIGSSGIIKKWRLSTQPERTADEYTAAIVSNFLFKKEIKNIKEVIICSVVPSSVYELKQFIKNIFNLNSKVIGNDIIPDIKVLIDRPDEVGADRLVNSLAAYKLYGGEKIVVDFGTATTFDVVLEDGSYAGGVISPGVQLSLDALDKATARLPRIAVKKPSFVVGVDTVTAMQSGIYWGYVGLLQGIVSRIKEESKTDMKVVATGGLANLFSVDSDLIDIVDLDLTIKGIAFAWNPSLNVFD